MIILEDIGNKKDWLYTNGDLLGYYGIAIDNKDIYKCNEDILHNGKKNLISYNHSNDVTRYIDSLQALRNVIIKYGEDVEFYYIDYSKCK